MKELRLVVAGLWLVTAADAGAETVRVFAASSLTEAFREIGSGFERRHPGVRVELQFAGTQVLRTQIEQGALADVLAAADQVHADALLTQGLLQPYRVFARNELVVVAPAAGGTLRDVADLARPGVKLVLAAASVPAGRYAREVVRRLGASGAFGPDYASRVLANVVSEETNVRAVLAKVALGEADAGFVYATDAASAAGRVRALPVPAPGRVEASYAVGLLTRSRGRAAATAFIDEVIGEHGQVVLRRHGFLP